MAKLVYRDGRINKALIGKLIAEDDEFFSFESQGKLFRVNKRNVVSIWVGMNNGKEK